MSGKDKWVRRFSIGETSRHKNGFTIYKITSVLFPLHSPEAVTVVSVWKRYSEVQRLHASMRALHKGLQLRGTFPPLGNWSYFKRFSKEVLDERAKSIITLLEFIAEHKLLFASTEFVNFLQTGYPEPAEHPAGSINCIRASLHLPLEDAPPIEYPTDDDTTPRHGNRTTTDAVDGTLQQEINRIPIFEAADVEIRQTPKNESKLSNSFESFSSMDSLGSDFYDELSKITIDNTKPSIKTKPVLPDLINFDEPSTSTLRFDDYHTMRAGNTDSDTISLNSTLYDSNIDIDSKRSSRLSMYSKQNINLSLSDVQNKTRTEDSYVFEAGYKLNLAARCENVGEYQKAFDCYKAGIEKMLIGAQSDPDPQRRALIKEKTNKYLSYAEALYRHHLSGLEPEAPTAAWTAGAGPSPGVGGVGRYEGGRARPYSALGEFSLLAVVHGVMLVLHKGTQACRVIKVVQKLPNNLTEFDEYFHQRTNDTKQPTLPTHIPYMVPLHFYIETNNLIFLVLSYAPGEKLFDYIQNYVRSVPNTPARELNLENVFSEPQNKLSFGNNFSIDYIDDEVINVESEVEKSVESEVEKSVESDLSVKELVLNSQELLKNVDKVLSGSKISDEGSFKKNVKIEVVDKGVRKNEDLKVVIESPTHRSPPSGISLLPGASVRGWAAEILLAIRGLHAAGVICRDLNPKNILLGDRGHIILTYMIGYTPTLSIIAQADPGQLNMYVAPECYHNTFLEGSELEHVCDYWSFGAILYHLVCGVPLSYFHRSVFTSHTLLQMPDGLDIEAESILTQLLTATPSERLGAGGIEEIQRHPYFKQVDWTAVELAWTPPD